MAKVKSIRFAELLPATEHHLAAGLARHKGRPDRQLAESILESGWWEKEVIPVIQIGEDYDPTVTSDSICEHVLGLDLPEGEKALATREIRTLLIQETVPEKPKGQALGGTRRLISLWSYFVSLEKKEDRDKVLAIEIPVDFRVASTPDEVLAIMAEDNARHGMARAWSPSDAYRILVRIAPTGDMDRARGCRLTGAKPTRIQSFLAWAKLTSRLGIELGQRLTDGSKPTDDQVSVSWLSKDAAYLFEGAYKDLKTAAKRSEKADQALAATGRYFDPDTQERLLKPLPATKETVEKYFALQAEGSAGPTGIGKAGWTQVRDKVKNFDRAAKFVDAVERGDVEGVSNMLIRYHVAAQQVLDQQKKSEPVAAQ